MRDHGSIGLFWEWCFFCGKFGFECFGLFLFCFCLVRGEKVTDAQDFGWQSKGEDHFRSGFLSFLVFLVTIQIFFLLLFFFLLSLPLLIGNFLSFFAFSLSLIGNFPSFCVFFRGQGLIFSPWVNVYGKLGFWLKACNTAGHDI